MKKYTNQHEWIVFEEGSPHARVGISDFAQERLGELVFVELPAPGRSFEAGAELAVVESVKAASEVYSPLAGEVVAVNSRVEETPALVNESPEDKGWLVEMTISAAQFSSAELMDEAGYRDFIKGLD